MASLNWCEGRNEATLVKKISAVATKTQPFTQLLILQVGVF